MQNEEQRRAYEQIEAALARVEQAQAQSQPGQIIDLAELIETIVEAYSCAGKPLKTIHMVDGETRQTSLLYLDISAESGQA